MTDDDIPRPPSSEWDPEPGPLPETFWLTRDRLNGRLLDVVEVWRVRPVRHRQDDGDSMWMAPAELVDKQDTWYAAWSLAEAESRCTIPDDEIQCIRSGPDVDEVLRRYS